MKKTITIYELLGLIKDGKAPKKIKLDIFVFEYVNGMYVHEEAGLLDEYISITNQLNTFVEILDEEEFEDIELLTQECFDDWTEAKAINKLIKNQKKIIERINNEKENR